jgi:hypothetical protein
MSWVDDYLDDYQHLINIGREDEVPEDWREILLDDLYEPPELPPPHSEGA